MYTPFYVRVPWTITIVSWLIPSFDHGTCGPVVTLKICAKSRCPAPSTPPRKGGKLNQLKTVGKTINHPFENGLYMFIPPIKMVIWGMVYCFTNIILGCLSKPHVFTCWTDYVELLIICYFPKKTVPQYGWFVENPIYIWMISGYPHFREPPYLNRNSTSFFRPPSSHLPPTRKIRKHCRESFSLALGSLGVSNPSRVKSVVLPSGYD